jgi:hypothetical protein
MSWNAWGGNGFPLKALAVALAAWSCPRAAQAAEADYGGPAPTTCQDQHCRNSGHSHHNHQGRDGLGPLGYGPPGLHPGFQGFGIGYHLGYGYGGKGLGAADGGYPFYGGPGYPHPWPRLWRFGGINPFPHFAGTGAPTPEHPNFYGTVNGTLVVDQPVISTTGGTYGPDVATSFGGYTGALPYPDSAFAPFTSEASGALLEMNPTGPTPIIIPTPNRRPDEPLNPSSRNDDTRGVAPRDRDLGFDQEPIGGIDHRRGMKVVRVYPGSEAEKAGLRVGDVIRSINDYTNTEPGNLPWVILHAAPDHILKMAVQAPNQTDERTVAIPIGVPVAAAMSRPDFSGR